MGNSHQNVGRYFMDHVQAEIGTVHAVDEQLVKSRAKTRTPGAPPVKVGFVPSATTQLALEIANAVVHFSRQTLTIDSKAINAIRRLRALDRQPLSFDEQLALFGDVVRDFDTVAAMLALRLKGRSLTPLIQNGSVRIALMSEQLPNRDGRVRLFDQRDRLGNRLPALDGQLTTTDYRTVRQTRMAARPKESVVDDTCRVFDCDNLFIAGSSIFPTGSSSSPTLTIVALAHRLADHLTSIITR